jgi:hypothetical protein
VPVAAPAVVPAGEGAPGWEPAEDGGPLDTCGWNPSMGCSSLSMSGGGGRLLGVGQLLLLATGGGAGVGAAFASAATLASATVGVLGGASVAEA